MADGPLQCEIGPQNMVIESAVILYKGGAMPSERFISKSMEKKTGERLLKAVKRGCCWNAISAVEGGYHRGGPASSTCAAHR